MIHQTLRQAHGIRSLMNKIIIISLVIFFVICSKSWAEDRWTNIYVDEQYKLTEYIDEASIIKVGEDTYFVWQLVSYDEIQQVVTLPLKYPTFKASSRITLWEFNCKEWFHYPVVEYSFSELMGKGIKIDTMNYTAPRSMLGEGITEGDTSSSMYITTKRLCE